eukprot:6201466-Pleurochrysis_carterae.AAC.3
MRQGDTPTYGLSDVNAVAHSERSLHDHERSAHSPSGQTIECPPCFVVTSASGQSGSCMHASSATKAAAIAAGAMGSFSAETSSSGTRTACNTLEALADS